MFSNRFGIQRTIPSASTFGRSLMLQASCFVFFLLVVWLHRRGWYLNGPSLMDRIRRFVLERVWSLENNSFCLYLLSVCSKLPASPFFFQSSDSTCGVVPAEDTPTLKSVGMSALECQSTVDHDVPGSWNVCYLYYLNGPSLMSRIRRLVCIQGCVKQPLTMD